MSWAETEFNGSDLGDTRRTRRLIQIAEARAERPSASLPQCFPTAAELKGAYEFCENALITPAAMLTGHTQATAQRMAAVPVVLAVQDTTEVEYTNHPATQGLGLLNDPQHLGRLVHSTLAVTPQRVPLGLIDQQVIYREAAQFGQRPQRRQRPIEAKESRKWLNSLEATREVQAVCPLTRLVSVGDREADVYDLFLAGAKPGPDLLVRAAWNRRVEHPEGYLWETLEHQPESGRLELSVPRRGQPPARTAALSVRHAEVVLRPPGHRAKERRPRVSVYAVLAREEAPPPGIAAIEWLWLTTVPVSDFDSARERIEWYACRWVIELYHKVLKSGCRIEARQFEAADHIERSLAIDAVVAWRILGLTFQSRESPAMSCAAFLEPDEWKALFCFTHQCRTPPPTAPSLKDAALWIAKLGGFLGRPGDGAPGITVMWRGLARLADITLCWQILNHDNDLTK